MRSDVEAASRAKRVYKVSLTVRGMLSRASGVFRPEPMSVGPSSEAGVGFNQPIGSNVLDLLRALACVVKYYGYRVSILGHGTTVRDM